MRCADRGALRGPIPILAHFAAIFLCLVLSACGGGGSGTSGTASTNVAGGSTAATSANPAVPVTAALTNFQDVVVDVGPANSVNALFASVTVCAAAGSSNCATIDHVLVDTGSSGLRLLASAVPAGLRQALPQQSAANGGALVECVQFADGFSWGPVRVASVKLGGETVAGLPIQIIGDPAYTSVPPDCSSTGPAENTVTDFGANGVLGVGSFEEDCGSGCATSAVPGFYYACGSTGCSGTSVATALQVRQPVTLLAKDNNGIAIQLPAVPASGAVSLSGSLIFGIGTETNNGLSTARVYGLDPNTGTLSIAVNGTTYANSFLDSGSNALFLPLPGTPVCHTTFYCPSSPLSLATLIQGTNGANASVNLTITSADTIFSAHPNFAVAPTLGGTALGGGAVDLGLPFFYGRTVFNAVERRNTPGGAGPYVAF